MRLVAILFLAACTGGSPTPGVTPDPAEPPAPVPVAQATQAQSVTVEGAWVRAMPPGTANTGLFATLGNTGTAQVRLVGGASDASGAVEIHTHTLVDGAMQMRQVDGLDVPGQGHLHLQPGGDHVMLIGLKDDLAEGSRTSVTLRFADGSELSVDAPVQAAPTATHEHGEDHDHEHGADHDHEHNGDHHHHHDGDHDHDHDHDGH